MTRLLHSDITLLRPLPAGVHTFDPHAMCETILALTESERRDIVIYDHGPPESHAPATSEDQITVWFESHRPRRH